jgi:mono/diheme cytochrome c family protein
MKQQWIMLACAGLAAMPASAAPGDPLGAAAAAILQQRCLACHSDKNAMSDLRLTAREDAVRGGKRGPAIKPGHAGESLLFQAVSHAGKVTMPPGAKLPDEEIETLRAWIDKGAEWPQQSIQLKGADWWAFHKSRRPAVPEIAGAKTAIDAFVMAKLQAAGLEPAAEADRLTLLRRACFDLHGLPPTPQQIAEFLNDKSGNAWERVIDALLASPRYGEKWGRHWLDLVRYGDTAGFEQDPYNLEAWRYRDYVIKSFNEDKPYDRFTKEQIAADELYTDDPEARIGTGYYRVGPNRDMLFKVEEQNVIEKMTDWVDTTSQVFLGLTVGCARCHDHKFDPIPQRDFYRMQAIFAPAVNDRVFLEYNSARNYDLAANTRDNKLRLIGSQIERIQKPYRARLREAKIAKLAPDVQAVLKIKAEDRTPEQEALAAPWEDKVRVTDAEVRAAFSQADTERLHEIEKRLVSMFAGYGPPPMAPGIIDVGREAPRTYVALRGNPDARGEEVKAGFLGVLGGGEAPEPPIEAKSTGRRKALANWLATPENPLFARVMVNRIWQFHFGSGLLGTPSDFGTRAGKPSHPELLDWLEAEFVDRKWSLKSMHKLIMMSDTYRRGANASEPARRKDPTNTLLSHANRRRLQAEEIRDAVLLASGSLNLKMEGMPVVPPLEAEEMFGMIGKPENNWIVNPDKEEHTRRSIYLLQRRTFQNPMFEAFDAPDGVMSCSRRNESTTAPQSLAMLNSRFMMEQAQSLSAKLESIEDAWRRVLGRDPSAQERAEAEKFLERQTARLGSKKAAYAELARGLLNLNEFLYVD